MKTITIAVLLGMTVAMKLCTAQTVRIDSGWYHIDGQKYFIKGIGYETNSRPGHLPWAYAFDADAIRFDLNRIKRAGFNTIRTWAPLSEEELTLVEESGLKVLFGIWIDNAGDYGDAQFKASTLTQVNAVLEYSNKYPCIIGYLIMNEPQVDQIYRGGAQHLRDLWQAVTQTIRQHHAGIPVSFSNAIIGDFIDTDMFDFTAYNAYIYNPITINYSHGYAGFLQYLKNNRAPQKPFIVTEFGLSVSPGTPAAHYTYGGNSLSQQAEGDLVMYRGLIDAGVQGGAVFQYHDGWWKAGNEFVHDSGAEEWFGLVGFSDLKDRYGMERPAWQAFTTYNKAIITEPKNEAVYTQDIPIEIFTTEDVRSFSVTWNDSTLLRQAIGATYVKSSVGLHIDEEVKDVRLTFQFFDAAGSVVKTETLSMLVSRRPLALPEITMKLVPETLNPGGKQYLLMDITGSPFFTIDGGRLEYAAHPHIGFDNGMATYAELTLTDNRGSHTDYFTLPKDTRVTTFGAGFTVRHGGFTKRICTQQILTAGAWADPIKAVDRVTDVERGEAGAAAALTGMSVSQNYPNPFNPSTTIRFQLPHAGLVSLDVFDMLGRNVRRLVSGYRAAGSYEVFFDASQLPSGVYFYRLQAGRYAETRRLLLMR